MYLEIVIPVLCGIILGTITGITPGIHINLITALIIAYSYNLLKILEPITIVITIVSMAIAHTVFDIIPSTILGIANTENLTMLLPAHQLTKEGKAKLAIAYGLIGSACGIIITIILMPLIIKIIPQIYSYIKDYIAIILIIFCAYVIIDSKNRLLSLLFFIISGVLGILSFNIKTIDQPLLPLLSGLFGVSALILSIKEKTVLKKQDEEVVVNLSKKQLGKYSLATLFASFLTNFLPGLTSSHTALITNKLVKIKEGFEYIILSNAANSSATIISFIAFYILEKTRSGAVVAVSYLISKINLTYLILIIAISLVALSISLISANFISNKIIKNVDKINYTKLSISIITLITIIVLVVTRLEGLLILITATSLGILAQKFNTERINLTGCLIFPVILYLTLV